MKDLIIIGTGPAGLSAAIYAARYKLNFSIIGKEFGGAINKAPLIENYLGVKPIKGIDLVEHFREQIDHFKIKIIEEKVIKIEEIKDYFKIYYKDNSIEAKNVILALGINKKEKIIGEEKFLGKGVSYCVSCDAPLYQNLNVAIIGEENIDLLKKYASNVYSVKNIKEIKGDKFVNGIILEDNKEVKVDGVFLEETISSIKLIKDLRINLDENNLVIVDDLFSTNIKGVYCIGDSCNKTIIKQLSVVVGQGAIASYSIFKKIKN
ncbi:MAG TPA: FAD-dependent oxidoreductase [Candidatus Nanoarchaeia archaeon]|nr:FAD-dependent oxidoreductase [Candidatus Nanoarchaeia archaeon]